MNILLVDIKFEKVYMIAKNVDSLLRMELLYKMDCRIYTVVSAKARLLFHRAIPNDVMKENA